MPRKIYVQPLNARKIDDPVTGRRVPPEGMPVEDSPFWRARQKAGEVKIVSQAATSAQEQKGEAKAVKKGAK